MPNVFSNDTDPLHGFIPVNPATLSLEQLRLRVGRLFAADVHSLSTPLPSGCFRCCACLRVAEKAWDDAAAAAEYTRRFPGGGAPDMRYVLCGACNYIISTDAGLEL